MNNQPHSVMNSMVGSNQRGLASSAQMYQMQQSSNNMTQLSHMQHQQQQQPHMMSSGYSSQKSPDMSSRQYSPSMSTLNGSAYQPMTGPNLHSGLNLDNNQMNVHQHNESPVHQYNQQQQHQQPPPQQHHHHQYPTSLQQQRSSQHQPYQSNVQNQQHQQQMQSQKQMAQHVMQQQPHQFNMHQGNQNQQQHQVSQHSQMNKPMQSHHQQHQQQQPYVHVQQRNMQQQQHQQPPPPKYDRVQQPRRILINTNSVNNRQVNHRPVAKEPVATRESVVVPSTDAVVPESENNAGASAGAGDSASVTKVETAKEDNQTEEKKTEESVTDKKDIASENKELANTKEKTPMTLVQELARFNKIEIKYTLLDEQGPAHKKTFFVKLLLGTEEYSSSGASIRKAQSAAAVMAMKDTKYKSPPERKAWRAKRDLALTEDGKLTPTVELNGLAMKRGESASYKAIEPQQPPYYYPPGMDPRAMYGPRYYHYMRARADPRFARGYWPMRYHYPRMSRAFYVSLRVGHREFIGDGPTRQAARHNAAIKALKVLKNLPQKEKVQDEVEPVVEETNEVDDELKSKVTSVHEIAFRRKLSVNFEVIRESGPPHMKTFVTRCTVGDMVTEGEGNSKKTSKKIAAEQMYEKFKELTPLPPSAITHKPRPQVYKKKRGIGIKADIQQQKADPNYGSGVNPISRLIQIMCAQKKKEPVYSLVAETGVSCRKEFVMQIEVLGKTCTGSGPNKKLAKRAAAEAMLELLGYNKPTPQPAKSSFKQHSIEGNGEKKVTFSEICERGATDAKSGGNQQKVPGLLHLPAKTVVSTPSSTSTASSSHLNSKESVHLASILKPNWRPELQLRELCKALKYPLEINDFTKDKGNNSVEYVSRINVGNNDNRQNFLGTSSSLESARDVACMEALKILVSRVKDMHPAGDGSAHMKKSVLSRTGSGMRGGDLPQ